MVTRRRKKKTNDNDVDDDEFEIIRQNTQNLSGTTMMQEKLF